MFFLKIIFFGADKCTDLNLKMYDFPFKSMKKMSHFKFFLCISVDGAGAIDR